MIYQIIQKQKNKLKNLNLRETNGLGVKKLHGIKAKLTNCQIVV